MRTEARKVEGFEWALKPKPRRRKRAPDPTNYLFTGLIVGILLAWIVIRVGDQL